LLVDGKPKQQTSAFTCGLEISEVDVGEIDLEDGTGSPPELILTQEKPVG